MEQNTTTECTHMTVAERPLIGTSIIPLAVQNIYRVNGLFEVYEYQVTLYNSTSGLGGFFVEFINTFLKLEAEGTAYPSWVRTPEDEEMNMFNMSEGILLDRNAIRHNAAKPALAKLCLNSMRGKLTEQNNRSKAQLISDPQEMYRFLLTPVIEVVYVICQR